MCIEGLVSSLITINIYKCTHITTQYKHVQYIFNIYVNTLYLCIYFLTIFSNTI